MIKNSFVWRTTSQRIAVGLAYALCTSINSAAVSYAADAPSVEAIESPAIHRGSTDELRIVGANLAATREVVFYANGIKCRSIEAKGEEELVLRLDADLDCPTGMHAFRLRNDEGFSELRTIAVTPYPVVRIVDSKSKLSINSSVMADLSDGIADRYSIELASGQRLSVDVEAMRLGIDMIDAAVRILDPHGREVASADDSDLYRQDPIASIVASQTGTYLIEVQDAGRNVGPQACYLLHLGDGPRPTAVFPLGGQPGSTTQLTFLGDVRGKWSVSQDLPELSGDRANNFQLFAIQNDHRSATPLPFRLSPLSNAIESTNNDDWEEQGDSKRLLEVPAALNGVIEQPLDRDCYWMRGVAGQAIDVNVFARRLGSAADTQLTIVDASQSILAQSDDVDSLDSRVEFIVPKDGKFGLAIEEKRGKGGDAFAYRIEVTAVQPTADVFLPRRERTSQDLQTVSVPIGNRVLALMALRKDDANGQAALRFPQLPEGMTAHFTQPRADQAIVPVVFEATRDAQLSGQLIPVEVSVHSSEATAVGQFRQVTDLVKGPADAIYSEHEANRLAICTRTAYPISITVTQPQASLAQDGTLDLHVRVERQPGNSGEVNLTLPWLPPWIDAEPRTIVPADASEAVIRLRAWRQAEVALWPLVVEASTSNATRSRKSRGGAAASTGLMISGDTPPPTGLSLHSVASMPVQLAVAQPPAKGHFEVAAAEQGESVEVVCSLNTLPQLHAIRGLVVTLEGLPNRVECEPVQLDATSKVIRFQVKLHTTAPIGRFVGLACRLTGKLGEESVSYVIARDGELTIDQPGKIVRDASGRPLSRVEALRKKVGDGTISTPAR